MWTQLGKNQCSLGKKVITGIHRKYQKMDFLAFYFHLAFGQPLHLKVVLKRLENFLLYENLPCKLGGVPGY